MRDMLGYDDDGVDEDGVNDIDITRMVHLQQALHTVIREFSDIFRYSVKGKAMDVPPMEFTISISL